ncbi:phthiocerol/phthiodiolone dimycocerosyl transferase family protein [Nocardia brasiliensis]|uniref:phthiocerol/phthiodiolone dimycocerosyl transferase family protein n=1 Tax=Nocardia brasiliensis TaxID=37326 RepID=UPI00142D48FE|nr:hypothetical protein [Nocardia brasiliensis]
MGYSTHVRGPLELGALTEAFGALRRNYPILSCRIAENTFGSPAFVHLDEPPFVYVGEPGGFGQNSIGIDDRTAGVRIQYEDTGTAWVTLVLHHSAADASHALWLLTELWRYYTDTVEGRPIAPRQRRFPESAEATLLAHGIAAPASTADRPAPDIDPGRPDTAFELTAVPIIRLTPEHTARLGQRPGVTVNALVSAALLKAVAEADEIELAQVRYIYPVNLRTRVDPRVRATDVTNFLAMETFAAATSTETEALARLLTDALAADLADGSLPGYYLNDPELLATRHAEHSDLPGTIMAANWGVIPEFPTPASVRIDDFQPIPQQHSTIGKSVLAPPRPRYTCFIYSFREMLTIWGMAPLGANANTFHTRLRELLDELVGGSR